MDPLSPKKRPGGVIESPFAGIRKVPKTSSQASHPYTQAAEPSDDDMLNAEEIALIERNRREALARKAAYQASLQNQPKPAPVASPTKTTHVSIPSKPTASPSKPAQSQKITSFFQKAADKTNAPVPAPVAPTTAPTSPPKSSPPLATSPSAPISKPATVAAKPTPKIFSSSDTSTEESSSQTWSRTPSANSASSFRVISEPSSPFKRVTVGSIQSPPRAAPTPPAPSAMDVDAPLSRVPSTSRMDVNAEAPLTDRMSQFSADASSTDQPVRRDPSAKKKLLAALGINVSADGMDMEEAEAKMAFARDPIDNSGKRPGDEGYNPRECRIPSEIYSKMTAAKKQYWDYKRNHFDEVVFFQQGDFYNLFACDADIGVQKFGLAYNRVLDSVGFNRKVLKDWAAKFSNMGYKVTVLEQDSTATTDEDKKAKSKGTSKSKGTEDRSVTNKITSGTVSEFEMFSDDTSSKDSFARYLLVIAEQEITTRDCSMYGISFIDTSTYEWGVTCFTDDAKSSQLETLLLRLRPKEVLYERSMSSRKTKKVLEVNLTAPCLSFLPRFPDSAKTQVILSEYFSEGTIPEALQDLVNQASKPNAPEPQLALSSVGAAITYFKELTRTVATSNPDEPRIISSVDAEIVSRARYVPYNVHADPNQATMILDAAALANLEILENEEGGTDKGTLLSVLDRCTTSFGRRWLRRWLCHPLRRADDIILRQSMVRWFFERPSLMENFRATLKRVKDLERILPRAESKNITITLFLDLLDSLEILKGLTDNLRAQTSHLRTYSPIDVYCQEGERNSRTQTKDPSNFVPSATSSLHTLDENLIPQPLVDLITQLPDLGKTLTFYGFDRIEARKDNRITPVAGTNASFDNAQSAIEAAKEKLEEVLKRYKTELKDTSLSFHFSKTENYSVVVSRSSTSIPSTWASTKAKAGNRYWTPEVLALTQELAEAESDLSRASVGALMSCLESFVAKGFAFDCIKAISLIGQLDVLMSLARFSSDLASETDVCLPEPFLCEGAPGTLSPKMFQNAASSFRTARRPFIDMQMMKHPFVKPNSGGRFIPNSVALGSRSDAPGILLVTGPNMGGKSTLLRQVCILTIMAQIGSFVPAESCRFTPVDRIFTRIGARDNIVGGQSTFMVELEETSKVLAQATTDSLIILDELGRGTSTFDGYSIAYAVLRHFESQASRVLFSTHYHKLTQEFNSSSDAMKVQQGHMACREENGHMTFLYQLALGPCPNSYGLEVAAMAHIPRSVLTRASIMSDMFEVMVDRKAFVTHHKATGTGGDNINTFSFVRLLKLLKSASQQSRAALENTSANPNQNQALNFFTAEVSRLWRQVRFVEASVSSPTS